ncbi:MAG: adenylyltransferase/cytidyltransferase family protein [Acidobacteria bacterium]|nr:adenylyltransferase/cytidyltransferase family protein [Acidobacteriota bacterium]MBI3279742.1 adenylyltransferase/cytidyltransferase family protein [Acidobacteriota bacterium]
MRLVRKAAVQPERLGVFPGAFNPPTRAHLALAEAALGTVDEVLMVVPESFPHKPYTGATLHQRLSMLELAVGQERRISVAVAKGGLFREIARECREHYGGVDLWFICGRDAAERILTWDYGEPGAVDAMLAGFRLLVAPRGGTLEPPQAFRNRVRPLPVSECEHISASGVRARIRSGGSWEALVPEPIRDLVRLVYGGDRMETDS